MSYIQPIIASAFSSYAANFTSRYTAGSQRNDGTTEDKAIGIVSGNDKIAGDNTAVVGAVQKSQETKSADDGKPKSASGDVLDLSDRAKEVQAKAAQADSQQASKEKSDSVEFESAALESAKFESVASEDAASEDTVSFGTGAKSSSGSEIELQDDSQPVDAANDVPLAGSLKSEAKGEELSDEEKQQVEELKARDSEVRIHENKHVAVGGSYVTGGPSYTYQTGPDGKKYAIGGEVGIDVSPVKDDPEATIQKMQTVAAAALAPAEPSSQDYKVAAAARQAEIQARAELNSKSSEEKEAEQAQGLNEEADAEQTQGLNEEENDGEVAKATSSGSSETKSKTASSITSHYTKSFAAGSVGKMISGQTSGTRFSAFA